MTERNDRQDRTSNGKLKTENRREDKVRSNRKLMTDTLKQRRATRMTGTRKRVTENKRFETE